MAIRSDVMLSLTNAKEYRLLATLRTAVTRSVFVIQALTDFFRIHVVIGRMGITGRRACPLASEPC